MSFRCEHGLLVEMVTPSDAERLGTLFLAISSALITAIPVFLCLYRTQQPFAYARKFVLLDTKNEIFVPLHKSY